MRLNHCHLSLLYRRHLRSNRCRLLLFFRRHLRLNHCHHCRLLPFFQNQWLLPLIIDLGKTYLNQYRLTYFPQIQIQPSQISCYNYSINFFVYFSLNLYYIFKKSKSSSWKVTNILFKKQYNKNFYPIKIFLVI